MSKRIATVGIAASFCAWLGTCACAATAEAPKVRDGLSPPAAAWSRAMEAGDLEALRAMQSPDVIAFPPGEMETKGVAPVMKGYADLFAKYTVSVHDDESHFIEQPPLVASWGRTTLTLHPKQGGADVVSHTRYTDVAIKTPEGWRYIVDHASTPKTK